MRYWKAFLIPAGLLWIVSTATAQVTNSTILGAVTDQSEAVVADAQVTITDVATGNQRTVKTGSDGVYVVENLKPGPYDLAVSKSGFKEKKLTGIVVQVSQRARIDVPMEVGTVQQTVDVSVALGALETENSSVGKVITTQDVLNLPLNGRQFLQLATLTPGVQQTYLTNHATTGGSISANGMSSYSNNTMVDGMMNQETGAGRMTFSPSIDMIQEFKIQSNTYDAEYGRTGGSQIEIVTKRGGRAYHGSAYEFIRNDALDARTFFTPGKLPPFKRNQFGATIGGHIPHLKKDFFFFSYEGLRLTQGLTAVLTLAPATLRSGDFSGTGTTIYDPQTLDPVTKLRKPFPNNVIPANRFSPVTTFFLNRFIPPATPGLGFTNNYVSQPTQTNQINQFSIRYDRDFSDKDSINFRYTRNKFTAILPFGDSGRATPITGLGEDVTLYGNNHKGGWTHIFNNTTMNTLNVGFSQYFQFRFNLTTNKGIIAASGLQGVNDIEAGIPTITISGFSNIADNNVSPIDQAFNNYFATDTFAKVWGKHSLKFGGSFLYSRTTSFLNLFDRGTLNFTPQYTTSAVGAAGNQFNAFAEFLLGTASSTSIFLKPLISDWRSHTTSGFVQDNWRFSPNLSINLGLRYDVYTRPFDTENREAAFDLVTQKEVYPGSVPNLPGVPPGSLVAETLGYPRDLQFPTTYNNWSPRIGFAWRMPGSQKTVIRGGAGVFYHWLVIDSATNLALGPPWVPSTAITCNSDVPCVNATSPFSSTVVANFTGNVANKTNRTPYVAQFSLGIQHEFTPGLSLEVNYVGNAAFKNLLRLNVNQAAPGPDAVAPRRPLPSLGTLNDIKTIGKSHYDSLQATVRKASPSKGLMFLAAYTWGHALGDSISGPQVSEGPVGGIRDFRHYTDEYGNTAYDVRHTMALSWIYQLPFGNGRPMANNLGGAANAIIGGWSLEGIGIFRTGNYFTPTDIVDNSNAGGSRPDVIGNPNDQSHSDTASKVARWFNTAAFKRAPQFTFGNSGAGIIEGPGYASFDLAMQKRFFINERIGLQFRTEFFNAFNHTNLGAPSTSFGAASFGSISTIVGTPRDIQFGLRLDF